MKYSQLVCFVCVILLSAHVFAQEKTIVTIGGSYWNAAYTWEDDDGDAISEIDPGNNFGPYLSVNRGKLNFGVSYMTGKYPITSITQDGEKVELDNEVTMTRGDLNVTVGYRAHRLVNLFVGLKHLNWNFESEYTGSDYDYYDYYNYYDYGTPSTYDYKVKSIRSGMLFGAGISGVVPLGQSGLYAFGSIGYLGGSLTQKYKVSGLPFEIDNEEEQDVATGLAALNIGLGYRWANGVGINVGYRGDYIVQTIEGEGMSEDVQDNTRVQGLNVTLSYSIR